MNEVGLHAISFRDDQFLMAEGLSPTNVLDYFYQSPFYARTGGESSVNEMIRRGAIAPSSASRIDGDIYMLVAANEEGQQGMVDMGIFTVQKFRQIVNRPLVPLDVFYIVTGTVYLAPGLGKLIGRHLETGIGELENMIDSVRKAVIGDAVENENVELMKF